MAGPRGAGKSGFCHRVVDDNSRTRDLVLAARGQQVREVKGVPAGDRCCEWEIV